MVVVVLRRLIWLPHSSSNSSTHWWEVDVVQATTTLRPDKAKVAQGIGGLRCGAFKILTQGRGVARRRRRIIICHFGLRQGVVVIDGSHLGNDNDGWHALARRFLLGGLGRGAETRCEVPDEHTARELERLLGRCHPKQILRSCRFRGNGSGAESSSIGQPRIDQFPGHQSSVNGRFESCVRFGMRLQILKVRDLAVGGASTLPQQYVAFPQTFGREGSGCRYRRSRPLYRGRRRPGRRQQWCQGNHHAMTARRGLPHRRVVSLSEVSSHAD